MKADTLDVLVADTAISFYNHSVERQQMKSEGKAPPVNLPVSRLQEILDSARRKNEHKINQ